MIEIDILTIFPDLFGPFLDTAFVGAARREGAAAIRAHDLRDWAQDRHRSVDDSPYGGGPGMVMTPEPLIPAIEALAGPKGPARRARVICLSPQGRPLDQDRLGALAEGGPLVLVCGRYEGFDQRVLDLAVDEEVSVGDYVLSGGEVPAMVLIEGLVRLLPGVLGNPDSIETESFRGGAILEGPQYTRPPIYRGLQVPEVLRSGDHAAIDAWRRREALARTKERRPDLLSERADPLDGARAARSGLVHEAAAEVGDMTEVDDMTRVEDSMRVEDSIKVDDSIGVEDSIRVEDSIKVDDSDDA